MHQYNEISHGNWIKEKLQRVVLNNVLREWMTIMDCMKSVVKNKFQTQMYKTENFYVIYLYVSTVSITCKLLYGKLDGKVKMER